MTNTDPVSVPRRRNGAAAFGSFLAARRNLLAVWDDKAFRAATFEFRLLRQDYFVCNSSDTVRRVFLDEHANYDRKSPQMRHALAPLLGDGLFVSDGALWEQRRAHCTPAFDAQLLPGFAAVMAESAQELAARWSALPPDIEVDMLGEMGRLTARIIGRSLFGDDTSEAEAAQVVEGFACFQRAAEQLGVAESVGMPGLGRLRNPWSARAAQRAMARVHEVIDRVIARHRIRDGGTPTLLSLLIDGEAPRPGAARRCPLHPQAARNEAIVMFMAGHETTANSLAWAWYLLDHAPHVAARLHAELDGVLGGRPPTYDDVARLPYARAVFEETMRLYPPVPVLSRQARASDAIRGKPIAPDTIMLVVPWLLHRHELYWERPNSFEPERFLEPAPRPDKFIYLPFSVGRRVCLGQRFGLTEGVLCLATLAQRFRPRLRPGHQVDIECRLTLRPRGGLPMRMEPRH